MEIFDKLRYDFKNSLVSLAKEFLAGKTLRLENNTVLIFLKFMETFEKYKELS